MRGHDLTYKEKSACSVKNSPVPESMICSKCSGDIEIWTDEEETTCEACGHQVFRKE
jgi:DNA-directed RNA polymerase subunit RPC12/RpoP